MKTIELEGNIDERHHLQARVPESVPSGPVRVLVFLPEEDEAGAAWTRGLATEWADDLADAQQDIYTLEDGLPLRPSAFSISGFQLPTLNF